MQVSVARGLMIGAGHNLEVSRHAGDAREVGNVAGWSGLSQDGCVIDAIEQAHAKDLAGTYPNCGCDAGPIAVVTVDEAKSVAILTDFELDRLNPAAPQIEPTEHGVVEPVDGQTTSANSRPAEIARVTSRMMSVMISRLVPRLSCLAALEPLLSRRVHEHDCDHIIRGFADGRSTPPRAEL